jgi:hypothetical protein
MQFEHYWRLEAASTFNLTLFFSALPPFNRHSVVSEHSRYFVMMPMLQYIAENCILVRVVLVQRQQHFFSHFRCNLHIH